MPKKIFQQADLDKIARCLEAEYTELTDHYRFRIVNQEERSAISLEIHPIAVLGEKTKGALVVVYAPRSHLQLHNVSGFVISEELGEVTFIGENGGKISGLVVGKDAASALYSNVVRELISEDFTKFGVEVMLSGVALSLAEDILSSDESS